MGLEQTPNGFIWTHEVYDVYTYPEGYDAIMAGRGEWYPAAIERVGPVGKCSILENYGEGHLIYKMTYDPKHPRCFYCGKFVPTGTAWKQFRTSPCRDCSEDISPW